MHNVHTFFSPTLLQLQIVVDDLSLLILQKGFFLRTNLQFFPMPQAIFSDGVEATGVWSSWLL